MSTVVPMNAVVTRVRGLALANALLMRRNITTLIYAVVVPLVPLFLLFTSDPDRPVSATAPINLAVMLALLFPVYYNLLSLFVTRRDDLVLKRLRTGEATDREIVVSMAVPGVIVVLVVVALVVAITAALGYALPVNLPLLLVGVAVASAVYAALAVWTAAWTPTAESAQLTSAPVLLLSMLGTTRAAFPESAQSIVALLPGAALEDLVRVVWIGVEPVRLGDAALTLAQTWTAAASPLLVLIAWGAVAVGLARRSLTWEPRV